MANFRDNFSKDQFMFQASKGKRVTRPLNAFFVFCNLHRQQLKQRMPHLTNQEVSKYLGDLWYQMTPEHKEMYYEEARRHRIGFETDCPCPECFNTDGEGEPMLQPDKKRPAETNRDIDSPPAPVKYGGYVPPFHVYSAQLKRSQRMESCQSKARSVPVPSFKTFVGSYDQAVFKCAKISSPTNKSPIVKQTGWSQDQILKMWNLILAPSGIGYQVSLKRQMLEDENSQAVASIMGSPKFRQDYDTAAASIYNMFLQQNKAAIYSTPKKYCSTAHYNLYKSPGVTTPQHSHTSYPHSPQANPQHSDTSSPDSPQPNTPKQTPHRGQKRVWMESYHSGLARQEEATVQVNQDGLATQSEATTAPSEVSNLGEEETNYVLVPCDIQLAKMLGWPVHMLQRVSKSMLNKLKEELQVNTSNEPMSLRRVPMVNAKTALAKHLHALADKAATTAIDASGDNAHPTQAENKEPAITIHASCDNVLEEEGMAGKIARNNAPVTTTNTIADNAGAAAIKTFRDHALMTQTIRVDDKSGILQPPNPHNSVNKQSYSVRTTVPMVDPIEPQALQQMIGCPRVWRPKFMMASVKHLHSS